MHDLTLQAGDQVQLLASHSLGGLAGLLGVEGFLFPGSIVNTLDT